MDETYKYQLKGHMKFLMEELVKAYHACEFDEYEKLKRQIYQLREMLNSVDRIISERQKLEKLEGLKL
jgi:hypothetical protein